MLRGAVGCHDVRSWCHSKCKAYNEWSCAPLTCTTMKKSYRHCIVIFCTNTTTFRLITGFCVPNNEKRKKIRFP